MVGVYERKTPARLPRSSSGCRISRSPRLCPAETPAHFAVAATGVPETDSFPACILFNAAKPIMNLLLQPLGESLCLFQPQDVAPVDAGVLRPRGIFEPSQS